MTCFSLLDAHQPSLGFNTKIAARANFVTTFSAGPTFHPDNVIMRKSDADNGTYFRTGDRVFCLNGKWFYQTREDEHGPFPSRDAAEIDLKRYVEEMSYFDGPAGDPAHQADARQPPTYAEFSLIDKDEPGRPH